MQTYYTKWYSPSLGREMEIKVWGHAGRPVLFIPCQDGRFYDFENYRYYSGTVLETGNIYPREYARLFYEGQKENGLPCRILRS